jgi:hypothetical protein
MSDAHLCRSHPLLLHLVFVKQNDANVTMNAVEMDLSFAVTTDVFTHAFRRLIHP